MIQEPPAPASRLHRRRWMRALLWVCGVVSLLLGAIGVVLPGLPTTPFVLLAAACFVRASPRAHAWLLRNRTFGPLLRQWEANRSLPPRVKRTALSTMVLMVLVSLWFLQGRPWAQCAVALGGLCGGAYVGRLPTRQPDEAAADEQG
jgi:uncharacterized membrane protein YbaN (DUF454 family)